MKQSNHSKIRQQQRGIDDDVIHLIECCGKTRPAPDNALIIELPSDFQQLVDKAKRKRLIVSADGKNITSENIIKRRIKPTSFQIFIAMNKSIQRL